MPDSTFTSFSAKLASRSRRAISISSEALVTTQLLFSDKPFPLLIQPAVEGVSLLEWAKAHKEFVEHQVLKYGGVLFRGFGISSAEEFQAFAAATSTGGLIDYTFRSTPRKQVSGRIYTSTEYPADQSIPLHNEMSYTRTWPMKIWFCCLKASSQGGATPIADSAKVIEHISLPIREKFTRHGVMYVRNYRQGVDLSYSEVFGTDNRNDIEQFCREAGIECEFGGGVQLRTRQICQAVAIHPKTGQTLWFNQAHLFHISSLDPKFSQPLLDAYGISGVPRNCHFGDGSPIQEKDLREIREAYRKATISFPWQEGDILMLDNMLVAHGRDSFIGERRIVVAMAEQYSPY